MRPDGPSPAALPACSAPPARGSGNSDLWAANRLVLQDAGVPAAQIHVASVPTGPPGPGTPAAPDGGWFFSHRSEKPCGRFAALARLRPAVPAEPAMPAEPPCGR